MIRIGKEIDSYNRIKVKHDGELKLRHNWLDAWIKVKEDKNGKYFENQKIKYYLKNYETLE